MKIFSDSIKGLFIHLAVILFLGISLILWFFYAYLPARTNHGETITVPNLVERNYHELEEMLLQRNLQFEVSDSAYLSKYPPLTIIRQFPKPGSKVKEGRKIFLTLNRTDVPKIALPQLNESLTHVKAVLGNMDLKIGSIERKSSPHFNLVLEAHYNGGPVEEGDMVPIGSSLVLFVGDGYGLQSFEMPNLFGKDYDEVRVIANALDINIEPLNIREGVDTTGQVLYVVHQDPPPHKKINIGEWIRLWTDIKVDEDYYRTLRPDSVLRINNPDTTLAPAVDNGDPN